MAISHAVSHGLQPFRRLSSSIVERNACFLIRSPDRFLEVLVARLSALSNPTGSLLGGSGCIELPLRLQQKTFRLGVSALELELEGCHPARETGVRFTFRDGHVNSFGDAPQGVPNLDEHG